MTLPDVDSLSTYGGALSDYSPVVDPTTDESAVFRNKYAANVAMMTQTACRAMRSFVGQTGATPIDPVVGFVHAAVWGAGPSLKPTVTRSSTGLWLVTWPTTVSSELTGALTSQGGGTTHTVNLRRARASVELSGSTKFDATARVTAANVVEVRGWTGAGVLDDLNGLTVTVWAW
jgi:hypothetical protein